MAVNRWFHTQNWKVLWGGVSTILIYGKCCAVTADVGSCSTHPVRGSARESWDEAGCAAARAPRVCLEQDRDVPAAAAWISAPSSHAPIAVAYQDAATNQPAGSFLVFQALLPQPPSEGPRCRQTPFCTVATSTQCYAPGSVRQPPSMPPTSSTPSLSRE